MADILTIADMESPRTPIQLADWYDTKYEEIRTNEEEVQKARLHQGLYAYFVPEIYPLVLYSLWKFPNDGVYCQPKIGSQGYDARIYPIEHPDQVHTIEVTWPQDGKGNKEVSKILNDCGFYGRIGCEFDQFNEDILKRVPNTAQKKALKDYRSFGGSSLLIVLDTTCSPLNNSERLIQIGRLKKEISKIKFIVNSVYLVAIPHTGIYPV